MSRYSRNTFTQTPGSSLGQSGADPLRAGHGFSFLFSAEGLRKTILFLSFFALAVNLRAPLTSLPPVIALIQADLHISQALAGFFSTIPVLCFGLATPLIAVIQARISLERAVYLTLWGVVLGTILRVCGGAALVIAGTLVIGVSLTFGNIVSLLVIARDFAHMRTVMTGILVCAMSVGAMLSSAFTAPLSARFGWRFSSAIWALLAIFAIALWLVRGHLPRSATRPAEAATASAEPMAAVQPPKPIVKRKSTKWFLAMSFAAHTFMFYGITAWLPDYLAESIHASTTTAGYAESLFQITGLIGCFGVPWAVSRFHPSHKVLFAAVSSGWFIMCMGTFLFPRFWMLWAMFGGTGGGGGYVVIFDLIMRQADDLAESRKVSAFVQGFGYIVASGCPTLLGSLHQWSGIWAPAFILLASGAVVMALTGILAAMRGTSR